MLAQQHAAGAQMMGGAWGPTGLEGQAPIGGGYGAQAVAGLGSTMIPGALAVGGIATGTDPFSLGAGAFKRGAGVSGSLMSRAGLGQLAGAGAGRIGMGLAGAGAVAGGFYVGAKALEYATGQMTIGAARRGRMEQMLGGQFGFQGGQGRGMSSSEVGVVSEEVRRLADDLNRTVSQVTRNLGMMKALGLDRKVRDVEQYRQTFKRMTTALDKIADIYGVTLQEAGQFLQGARVAGFRTIADQMATLAPVRQAQWATGMTRSQVQRTMMAGTQLARAVGATGWRGAIGAQRAMVGFGAAERAGIISEGMMEEATGARGAQAYASMAQISQRAIARRLSSRSGRYFLAAAAGEDMRRLDPERMREVLGGGMSMGDIKRQARQSVYGRGKRGMSGRFLMYEEEMRGQMMQRGLTGLAGMVRAEMGGRMYQEEDHRINRAVRKAYGLTKRQAEIVLRTARKLPEMLAEQFRQEEQRLIHQAGGRGPESGIQRIMGRLRQWRRDVIDRPLQEVGEGMGLLVNDAAAAIDRALGGAAARQPVVRITGAGRRLMGRMGAGELPGMEGALGLTGGGAAGGMAQRFPGFETRGAGQQFLRRPEVRRELRGWLESRQAVNLRRGMGGFGEFFGITRRVMAAGMAAGEGEFAGRLAGLTPDQQEALYSQGIRETGLGAMWAAGREGPGGAGEPIRQLSQEKLATLYRRISGQAGPPGALTQFGRGVAQGAQWGAGVGSILPGPGTVVGAGVGAVAGVFKGLWNWARGETRGRALIGTQAGKLRAALEGPVGEQIAIASNPNIPKVQRDAAKARIHAHIAQRGDETLLEVAGILDRGDDDPGMSALREGVRGTLGRQVQEVARMTQARMGRLNIRDWAGLQEAGLGGDVTAIMGQAVGLARPGGFQERREMLGGFFEKYGELTGKQRARARGAFAGAGYAGAEFTTGMAMMEQVAGAMRGKRRREYKPGEVVGMGRARAGFKAMGIEIAKEDIEGLSSKSEEDIAKQYGVSTDVAKAMKEGALDKKFTGKEMMAVSARRAVAVAERSLIGAGAGDVVEQELGAAKGFGTASGMHAELRRQSTILLLIHDATKGGADAMREAKDKLGKMRKEAKG